ncbi:retrotransposable element Tf2 [Tanacetum coccineum]|uniref:Retrotransposable element Tf2 n=1 Tax=Tanacetum coccineum TaxID=301880 RepID=A0ABQ5I7W9_9ASTR
MMGAPVLKLPNFDEDFLVKTDTSWEGIGAVLQQQGHPVAYGKENVVVDALSRVQGSAQLLHMLLSIVSSDVRQRIAKMCQLNKANLAASPSLLQPLPIPQRVWLDISIDFLDGLPMSKRKTMIMVVVDRLSKHSYFIPLSHPYTSIHVAQVLLDNIYKLDGLPKVIVSDRDKVFISIFWQELFKKLDVSLRMSTAYYLQTQTTPFEVLYGQVTLPHIAYVQGDINVDVVDRSLSAREDAILFLKLHLKRSHDRMKSMPGKKRSDREFELDAWMVKKGKNTEEYVLVQWMIGNKEDATWELLADMVSRFSSFYGILEDKN